MFRVHTTLHALTESVCIQYNLRLYNITCLSNKNAMSAALGYETNAEDNGSHSEIKIGNPDAHCHSQA